MTEEELSDHIHDGKVTHSSACDILYAEFQSWEQEHLGRVTSDEKAPRECPCEEEYRRAH